MRNALKSFVILYFLLGGGVQEVYAGDSFSEKLRGVWEGTGKQDNVPDWSIRFTSNKEHNLIEYPSVSCSGTWKLSSETSDSATFSETIEVGRDTCLIEGTVTLSRIGRNKLLFEYADKNSEITAHGVLTCKSCNLEKSIDSCHRFTKNNPGIYHEQKGYGAVYNIFSQEHETLLKAACGDHGVTKITVGSDNPNVLVFNKVHILDKDKNAWVPFTLFGNNPEGEFFRGKAEYTFVLTEKQRKEGFLFISTTCSLVGGEYKCGCIDETCTENKWQIQKVKVRPRLLTTLWNQYQIASSLLDQSEQDIVVPGCTAVAVGQLVNYYYQHGYSNGWLDRLLGDDTIAYPRVGRDSNNNGKYESDEYEVKEKKDINFHTEDTYLDKVNKNVEFITIAEGQLINFLYHVGIALDANFEIASDKRSHSTGVSTYKGQEPYIWLEEEDKRTMQSLLINRFRFRNGIQISKKLSSLSEEKDYIIKSIDSSLPVLASIYGNRLDTNGGSGSTVGHTVLIDNYGFTENGKFLVQINMGWGTDKTTGKAIIDTAKWYSGDSNMIVQGGRIKFSRFYIYKDTVPIEFHGIDK